MLIGKIEAKPNIRALLSNGLKNGTRNSTMELSRMNPEHRKKTLYPILTAIESRVTQYWEQFGAPIALTDLGRSYTATVKSLGLDSFTALITQSKVCVLVSNRRGKRYVSTLEQREFAASTVLDAEPEPKGAETVRKQGFLDKLKEFKGG